MTACQRRAERREPEVLQIDLKWQIGSICHFTLDRIVTDRGVEADAEQMDIFRINELKARRV